MDTSITFDELMKETINTIDDIETSTTNVYIVKECNIITIKLDEINARKYNMVETVESICNSILKDISNMRGVLNQKEEIYAKYDTLEEEIKQIPELYTPL